MNVLTPISPGGERIGEPHYTSTAWSELSAENRARFLKDLGSPDSGVRFEFMGDEGRNLRTWGRFNGPEIGGYAEQLLGVKTRTLVDKDGDTMIELLGQFRQDTSHPLPNNTIVGTLFPRQLTSILDEVIVTGPGPVSR